MARRKAKRGGKSRGNGWLKRWLEGIHPDQKSQFFRRALGAGLLAVIVAGACVGLDQLDHYVQRIHEKKQVKLTVELKGREQWLWASDELIESICLSSGVRCDDQLLDKTLTLKWAENLEQNPWVKKVRQIHKRYDGRVMIDCEIRQPIACIYQGKQKYYMDREGVVLPEMPVFSHVIELRGSGERNLALGEQVRSQSLAAGLQVLSLIREVDRQLPLQERLWQELAVLDVKNFEGRIQPTDPHIKLYTRNDTEIRWGAAVGRERPYYEAPAKYKLASLYRAYKKFGSLDEYGYVELRDLRKERCDPLKNG